jgi:hypothetical protein
MSSEDFWYESAAQEEQPDDGPLTVGNLTMDDVRLDQLRQAVFERVEHLDQIPELLRQLNATDWAVWLADMPARVATCTGCHRYVRLADATTLPELVWLGDSVFCHACAQQVLADHTFTCEACGHEFHARNRPMPFAVCAECESPGMTMAMSSLAAQLLRARRLNLPATLTLREWLDTLEYFGWRCAYCRRADFACMDHFMPVAQGGGTTQANCVPACVSCNSTKGGKSPHGYVIKPEAYARVARYLEQFE